MRNYVSKPLDRACAGRVLSERDMRSHLVIIGGIFRKDPSKVLRVERDQTIRALVPDRSDLFNPSVILIEDKASGTQLIQDLIETGLSKVRRYKPDGDKIMRLHAQTAAIENGFVHLPREGHWLADYLHELTVFPNGRHDDQVDSTSQALAWTKQRPPGWGWIEYYRDLAERANGTASPSEIRLKTPPGVTHVYAINGQLYAVRDEFVTVAEENAPSLLREASPTGRRRLRA